MTDKSQDKELQALKRKIERDPNDLESQFRLGRLYHLLGRHQEAIPHLMRAKERPELFVTSCRVVADCFEAIGMCDMAAHFRRKSGGDGPGGSEGLGVPARLWPGGPGETSVAKDFTENVEEIG